jgi:hypothetical protein
MNLLSLQQAVYRRVKLADSPSSADVTRITQFINLWHRRILAAPGMDRLRDTTLTFNTVVGQAQYGLPQALTRIRNLYDLVNQRRILPMAVEELRTLDPGLTAVAATVYRWLPLNGWAATQQILTQTGVPLWAVSSSASDTTQNVYVEAIRLGGVRAGMVGPTTLNGTTRVQVDSNTDYIDVVKFFANTVPVGVISLYDAQTNGNLLAQITPGRTQARYFMIQLYPSPSAVLTISVDCQRAIEDLTLPQEDPLLPEDYHQVLVHAACYEEWLNRSDDRAEKELQDTTALIAQMRHYLLTNPDEIPVQRGSRGWGERMSRLGGYYPVDRY